VQVPYGTYVAWYGAIGLLVLGALAVATRRQALVVCALSLGVVAIPMAANAHVAHTLGYYTWQSRYLLWWAAGLPIVAATVIAMRIRSAPEGIERRLAVITVGVLAVAQLGAFWTAARRYATGVNGRLLFLHHSRWAPPGGWYLTMALLLLGLGGLVAHTISTQSRSPGKLLSGALRGVPWLPASIGR
jgi:hypothetical protein